jgi:asparagine synthase (glutamine-hydrolysing)
MCGIAGIFAYGYGNTAVRGEHLLSMCEAIAHRGPDDAGSWINERGDLGLGHRRLSIIDLSAAGRQPMSNEDGTVWVTFNGEIYNYQELQLGLERRGHRFGSRTDTEVIVHLYEERGGECIQDLDGMFAFAIWDDPKRRLMLVRDRLGVKPLYYVQRNGWLVFASEIKAILRHPAISAELDEESLYHYLTFKTTPAPQTMFAGIKKLAAGTRLCCDRHGNLSLSSYWDPADAVIPAGKITVESAAEEVRERLDVAVKKRMRADVPVGVFLSGGLDSSAVVGLAAGCTDRPIETFSIGIRDLKGHNELEYAREISLRFGTRHHEILYGQEEVEECLPSLAYQLDEPVADPVCVPLYYLARLAREAGIIVVQVGEGSDEQFLGYDSRIEFLKSYERKWQPFLALPRPALWAGWHLAGLFSRATGRGNRLRRILEQAVGKREPFWGSAAFGENGEKSSVLTEQMLEAGYDSGMIIRSLMNRLIAARPDAEMAARVSYLDLKLRLPELLLMRVDKVTMSVGVEAREPFLDYRLVEFLMGVPRRVKLSGWNAKHVLKQAVADIVPPRIIRRPKQAFAAPINEWLRKGLGDFARRVITKTRLRTRGLIRFDIVEKMLEEHLAGRKDFGVQLWTIMNLCAWYDQWIDGPSRRQAGLQHMAAATGN